MLNNSIFQNMIQFFHQIISRNIKIQNVILIFETRSITYGRFSAKHKATVHRWDLIFLTDTATSFFLSAYSHFGSVLRMTVCHNCLRSTATRFCALYTYALTSSCFYCTSDSFKHASHPLSVSLNLNLHECLQSVLECFIL